MSGRKVRGCSGSSAHSATHTHAPVEQDHEAVRWQCRGWHIGRHLLWRKAELVTMTIETAMRHRDGKSTAWCSRAPAHPLACLQPEAKLVVGYVGHAPAQLLLPLVCKANSRQAEQALAVQVYPRRRLKLHRAGGTLGVPLRSASLGQESAGAVHPRVTWSAVAAAPRAAVLPPMCSLSCAPADANTSSQSRGAVPASCKSWGSMDGWAARRPFRSADQQDLLGMLPEISLPMRSRPAGQNRSCIGAGAERGGARWLVGREDANGSVGAEPKSVPCAPSRCGPPASPAQPPAPPGKPRPVSLAGWHSSPSCWHRGDLYQPQQRRRPARPAPKPCEGLWRYRHRHCAAALSSKVIRLVADPYPFTY